MEKRVLRRIFGPEKYEVTGKKKGLHNEELNNLDSFPNIIEVIKSRKLKRGACSTCGGWERRGSYRVLVGKEPLGRPRRRLENNIKINFQEVEWGHGLN
jgi:hypothetical protein